MDRKEKRFEIGQRVRIIGPTAADTKIHVGKCFVIEEAKGVLWKNGPFQYCVGYSKHGSIHAWPASSLELAEPEYVINEEHGLGHMEPRFITEAEPVNPRYKNGQKKDRIDDEIRGIRIAINILIRREQELQEESKRLAPKKKEMMI